MAKKKAERSDPPAEGDHAESSRGLSREEDSLENWADKPDSEAYMEAAKLYSKIQKCYDNKDTQTDRIEEYWDIYNAQPDENAQYVGNSTCYIPEVRNCVNARAKRALKQLFPANQKHVDAVGSDPTPPYPILSLLEHYIRSTRLKNTVRADLIAGDVTGQWNLYVDWTKSYRQITKVVRKPPILENVQNPGVQIEDIEEGPEELEDEEIITEGPDIVPFATEDLAVYPPTVNDIEKSVASSIRLRMSKEKIQQMIDEGVFVGTDAEELVEQLGSNSAGREKNTPPKARSNEAGVRTEGTYKYALIYEVATNLPLGKDKKAKSPAYVYFAGENIILGIIRNPQWSGKRPTLSASLEEITGSFFGISKIEPVKYLQWNLNDYWNMGQDSAQYSLLPVIMTDPLKQPNYQTMVMGLAAVWLADPNSTKAMSFPALWKDAVMLCGSLKAEIRESMEVDDAMLGKMPTGRKNSAQIGAMTSAQQTNTTDHAERYEEMMLNPLIERIVELDQQFRTESLTIVQQGDLGVRAKMTVIEPQQFDERYFFRWSGTDYAMGLQRMQQMIAWMNVLRGIPPNLMNGRKLDITPILEFGTDQIFGPEIAPRILIDERNLYTVGPDDENVMLHNGIAVDVHPSDPDPEHIKSHQMAAMFTGDPTGLYRAHIAKHMMQLNAKRQQQMGQIQQQQRPPGLPGSPGGAGPGLPGQPAPGQPRPGAQPGMPRPQGPAGMIHQDQIQDGAAATGA